MKYLIILLFALFSTAAYSQKDTGAKGGISIPRDKKPDTTVKPSLTTVSPDVENPFKLKPDKKNPSYMPAFTIGKKKEEFSMTQQENFIDRSKEFADRTTVKPRGESAAEFKGNQDFGEIRTKSEFVDIMAADFGAEDGDIVRVLVNGQVVIPEFTLYNTYKPLHIRLDPGFNNIEFEAMNQGTSGPNTALFIIYDNTGKMLMKEEWGLCTGFKGRVMVFRE